ncbi:MAG: hypothetical protein JJ899_07835 [Alphaproteobacteria bacterium]|nr:hypothetical protein [Alphaproteobacteria bacterium]
MAIDERWAPVTGRRSADETPPAFRRRWLAAVICLAVLFAVLALLA